jgi:F420-non-reducing hydrogenase small subunit
VLAPDVALCESCPRKHSKPDQFSLPAFKRPHQVLIDEEQCLLTQGLVCLGPATRGGCGSRCITGNMPCTGCFGPTSRVRDGGAKAFSGSRPLRRTTRTPRALSRSPTRSGNFMHSSVSLLRRRRLGTGS